MSLADVENATAKRNGHAQMMTLALFVGAALLGVLMATTEGHFIPDADTIIGGAGATAALTVFLVAAVLRAFSRAKGGWSIKTALSAFLSILAVVCFGAYYGSQAFILGLPDIHARFYGALATRQVTVTGWSPEHHSRHSHTCAGVTIAEMPSLIGNICLSRQVLPGTVLVLHGHQSVFGFHVNSIDS